MVGGLALLCHRQYPRDGPAMAADHQLTLVEATEIGSHVSDAELLHDANPVVLQIRLVQHT
jgi:hypothetical protein